jgi:hypothetical protein
VRGPAAPTPGLLYRLATVPGERQAAARRAGHHSPAQFLIYHTASLTTSSVRSKLARHAAAAGRGVGPVRLRAMRDPAAPSPIPRRAEARRAAAGERSGLLAYLARPKRRSGLRVREPRRLPRGLDRAETIALLASFRTN